jgi:hypothetical protein
MDPVVELINPSIFFGQWEFREPMTTLTDFLVAAVCLHAYWQMGRQPRLHRVEQLMRGYFLCMGLGTFLGGLIGHGLQAYLGPDWKMLGWGITSLGLTLYALSSIELVSLERSPRYRRAMRHLVVMLYGLLLVAMALPDTRSFFTVRLFTSLLILGLVLPIHAFLWVKIQNPGSRWVLLSMATAVLTGIVFSSKFAFDRWFNHHDISHLLMAFYSYLLFMAAQRFIPADWRPASSVGVGGD